MENHSKRPNSRSGSKLPHSRNRLQPIVPLPASALARLCFASNTHSTRVSLSLADYVTPGEPLLLKVVGSESNSRRWFGVFQTW